MPLQVETIEPSAGQEPARLSMETLAQVLGDDWLPLRDVPLGREPIDLVLLHPRLGIALLQFAPRWTVDAPERLRHRLDQARFSAIFHGHLPVVHRLLQPGEVEALPRLLAEAFAGQPELDLPAGDAWLHVVHRALLVRPLSRPDMPEPLPRPARRRGLQIAGGFALSGLLAAAVVLARPGPTPEPLAVLAGAITAATPLPAAAASPVPGAAEGPAPEPEPLIRAAAPADASPLAEARATKPSPADVPPLEAPVGVAQAPLGEASPPGEPPPTPAPEAVPAPPHLLALASMPPPAPAVPQPPPSTALAASVPTPPSPPPPPPLIRVAPGPGMDPAARAALLRRGEALLALGDVSGARRFFERVAEAGDPAGARAMGRTHDPAVLAGLRAWGIAPDPVAATGWYRRAREMESTDMTETRR